MKSDASFFTEGFTTGINIGRLPFGTTINSGDKVTDVVKNMLLSPLPSTEYVSKNLGTWSSTTDVENFFSSHNVNNGFEGIKIGNYVTIQDGTYNVDWVVAGFTCEHNATASDGTVYDNGIGMLMVPKTQITTHTWHSNKSISTPYISSTIHSFINSTVYNKLKSKLSYHIIQRNVLLGSEQNGSGKIGRGGGTSAYTWTKSYLTLMSAGQMTGTFASNENKYDDGEANYKLPLFNYESHKTGSFFWSRSAWGFNSSGEFLGGLIDSSGEATGTTVTNTNGVRPLMLLR